MSALLALLQQKKKDIEASKKGKTMKPLDGTSRYRLFPSWRGEGQQFWHDFGQHFIKNASEEILAIYVCAEKTHGKPCGVCSAINQGIKGATDDATMGLLNEAQSGAKVLLNALHLDGSTPNKMEIFEVPPTVFSQIVGIATEWEEAGESIFDKDILITRTGKGKMTKYTVMVAAKTTVLPEGVGLHSDLHDLDKYVAQETTDGATRALNGVRTIAGLTDSRMVAGAPRMIAGAASEEDPYAAAAAPAPRRAPAVAAAPAAVVTDVAVKPAAPKPAAAPVAPAVSAPAAAAVAAGTGDSDLDDLIAALG